MYYMYIDRMEIPIPPPEMTTTVSGKNETIDLIGKGEVNILKPAGLTEVSFKFMLPNSNYPFNQSTLFKGRKAKYYIDELKKIKKKGVIQFIMVRMSPKGSMLAMTNMKATLEDWSIEEAAEEGLDMYANVKLKKWKDWGAKRIEVTTDENGNAKGTVQSDRPTTNKEVPKSVKSGFGATLQQVVRTQLGNPDNLFAIAALNKIAVPALLTYGQLIKLKDESLAEKVQNGGRMA
ncbi:MAG: hypothetical protein ACFNO6_00355 [Anaeroglobus sp.]